MRMGETTTSTAQLLVIDIPATFARSALSSPRTEVSARRTQLELAVRAVMTDLQGPANG